MSDQYLLERRKLKLGITTATKEEVKKIIPKMSAKKIKPRSKKMTKEMIEYNKKKTVFLKNNPSCGVCGGIPDQVHHKRGRIGKNLLNEKHWLSVCADCHRWIEEHPEQAKEMGYSESRLSKKTA
jgi:hypothetical protein